MVSAELARTAWKLAGQNLTQRTKEHYHFWGAEPALRAARTIQEGSTYIADNDGDSDEARTLRPLQAAACTYRIAFGPRAGQKGLTVQGAMPRQTEFKQTLCAGINGNRVARSRALRGR